ncbi:hypothetical protein BGZ68_000004 [Mortierella alpina]|nr:hypothetical protein BGZ68_000004 [Mortierella alpina]
MTIFSTADGHLVMLPVATTVSPPSTAPAPSHGDITKLKVDAIVNAANVELKTGEGVCGAIFRAAGHDLAPACNALGGCMAGEARITKGFKLPCNHIIHAVGPENKNAKNAQVLRRCYFSTLTLASNSNIRSLALPCISTGICGFDNNRAAAIAIATVSQWIRENPEHAARMSVIFCTFMETDKDIYDRFLPMSFTSTPVSTLPAAYVQI